MARAPERITTRRLVGERIREHDLDDFRSYYGDGAVMRFLDPGGHPWAPEAIESLLTGHIGHWAEHGFGTWVFRDPRTRAFMGRGGLRRVDLGDGPEVELFYGVASSRWGEGLATEMATRIVEAASDDMRLEALVAFTLPTNRASRRVLEKLDFEADGEITHEGLRYLLFRRPCASSEGSADD